MSELEKILPRNGQIDYGTVPKQEFNKVLAAVPTSILTAFFMFGGKIYLTPEKKNICSLNNAQNAEFKKAQAEGTAGLVSACWGPGKDGGLDLWVDPANTGSGYVEIHHGTVRAFGHMLAEIFLKFRFVQKEIPGTNAAGKKSYYWQAVRNENQNESNYLEKLARTFEAEIALKNRSRSDNDTNDERYDLSQYESLRTGENRRIFEYFVFGEAFDSFYCSDDLRDDMRQRFPDTYVSMEAINRTFANDSGRTYGPISYSEKRYQSCLIGCEIQHLTTSIPLTEERRVDLDRFYEEQSEPSWASDQIRDNPDNSDSYRARTYADNNVNYQNSQYAYPNSQYENQDSQYQTSDYNRRGFVYLEPQQQDGGQMESIVGSVLSQAGGMLVQGFMDQRQVEATAKSQLAKAGQGQATPIGTGAPQGGLNPDGTPIVGAQNQSTSGVNATNTWNTTSGTTAPSNTSSTYNTPPRTPTKAAKKSSSTCGVLSAPGPNEGLRNLWLMVVFAMSPLALSVRRGKQVAHPELL